MRRLLTCALSCVVSFAVMGQANAATSKSVQPQPALVTAVSVLGLDPFVPSSPIAVDSDAQGSTAEVAAAPSLTAPGAQTAGQIIAIDSVRVDAEAGLSRDQPPSALADLLMWGVPTRKPDPGATASLSKHATHTIEHLTDGILNRTRTLVAKITESAMLFIGTPYVFGGTTTAGIDCSAFVQRVFAAVGISLPRTADAQYLVGQHIDTAHAKRGDLVFFQTYASGASHVGIYLGNDQFIHSSSSRGVSVSSLRESYWAARYLGAERVLGSDRVGVGTGAATKV